MILPKVFKDLHSAADQLIHTWTLVNLFKHSKVPGIVALGSVERSALIDSPLRGTLQYEMLHILITAVSEVLNECSLGCFHLECLAGF